jgi:hypothetical protein
MVDYIVIGFLISLAVAAAVQIPRMATPKKEREKIYVPPSAGARIV